MDKQSKMKPSNLERYKSGESKFMSMEHSRQLRALKKRQEQKQSRDVILKKMRGATSDTPQTKPGQCSQPESQAPSAKKLSKNELKELGIKRYHEMLKWKEEKRKLLEKEKRARKPTFKTGVVQPDKPQYLQDVYVDKKAQTTPFKFNVLSRDSAKKSFISSVSKENSNIFGRSSMKALSFHTGVTPQTSGAASFVCKIVGGRRANRVFRPPPEFGITPLPKTPSVATVRPLPKTPIPVAPSRSFNILKESKSFAPNTFNFQAPEGLRRYTIKQPSTLHSAYNSPSKKEELEFAEEVGLQILENDRSEEEEESSENNEFERSSLRDTYLIDNNNKDETKPENEGLDSENVSDLEENLPIGEEDDDMKHAGEIEQAEEKLKENEKTFEEVEIDSNLREKIDEQEVKIESEQMDLSGEDLDKKVMVQDVKCDLSGFEEEINPSTPPTLPVKEENEKLVEHSENNENLSELNDYQPEIKKDNHEIREYLEDDKETIKKKPINIKSSKKKRSKSLSKFTPPLSKLRPRTPCSRSTRRSLLAHCNTPCDHNPITTPLSRRRKSKKSLTLNAKTDLVSEPAENFVIKNIPEVNSVDKTPTLSAEDDIPNSTLLSEERINELENSPWITRSRGSHSSNSSKRKSVFKTKIEGELKIRFGELEKCSWISKSRGSSKSLKRNKSFSDPSVKRTRQLESSPWVTVVRGSSSLSKKWKRKSILERDSPVQVKDLVSDVGSPALKKRSWFPLAIESYPLSGSKTEEPINVGSVKDLCDVGSPLLKESFRFDDEVPSSPTFVPSLPEVFVQRQTKGISESPDVCVWGPDSASNSPVVAVTDLPNCDNSSETKVETESNRKPKRRSSKRVSLFVDPDKENTDDISCIKYPVTPRRRSSRISSVGSQRVSLLPGLYPHDENIETSSDLVNVDCDLISLDSPAVAPPGGKGKLKSRLSQRVSLLPGLSSHPEVEDQSPQYPISEVSDLISWDSPLVISARRKSRKKSNADTPLRRSKRFSKI
ncbi:UNVERIFIED_CONTAM: hypothetical protein RMT77_013889 [Armadillidium vulgare]